MDGRGAGDGECSLSLIPLAQLTLDRRCYFVPSCPKLKLLTMTACHRLITNSHHPHLSTLTSHAPPVPLFRAHRPRKPSTTTKSPLAACS